MTRHRKGFTLVELLVVIGIIALLISILMPSLARARQSASLVACESNFKQVYTALSFYANENKGLLPWASVMLPDGSNANTGASGTCEQTWLELSQLLGTKVDNVWNDKLSPVFTCTEAELNGTNVWAPNMIRTILFHPRAMPGYDQQINDFKNKTAPPQYPQRKLASIRSSAEKVAFWEGAQLPAWNATSEPEMQGLDNWRSGYGHMYREEISPTDGNYWDNNRRQEPVDMGSGNRDDNWFVTYMRFRHMKNTSGPIAFWDGHVESRTAKLDASQGKWVPDVKVEEIRISN